MSTPPDEPAGAPDSSRADQLKADGKTAALEVAKGAAVGGWVGAAKGLGTAVVKTDTGRKAVAAVVLAPVALIVITVMVISSVLGGSTADVKGGMDLAHAYQADTVALKQSEDRATLTTLQSAAEKTGVRWEVLAAIWQRSTKKSFDKGQGPLGIDMSKVKDGEITADDAGNVERAALFLGQKLDAASADTVYKLANHDLDAGYASIVEDGGEPKREELPGEEAKQVRQELRDQYIAAIKLLPIKGNPDIATQIFTLAQAWASGKEGPNDVERICSNDSAGGDVTMGGTTSADLNDIQKKHVQEIINQVSKRGMTEQVAVIALITAYQESRFRMYWNVKVPGSLELTSEKDAIGSDGYSVGLFQQQVNGTMYSWGTVVDAMSPQRSTDMFVDRLMKVPGWETMAPGKAAQAVQVSAFPDAYANHIALAKQLVNDLKPTNGSGFSDSEEPISAGSVSNTNNLKVTTDSRVTKNIQAVQTAAIAKFADKILALGDYRTDGEHSEGRAADLMIANYASPAGVAAGDAISQFYIDNKAVFNIEYLIFNDRIWLGPSLGWKKYSGTYGHMYDGNWNDTTLHKDHIHITTGTEPGTGGEYAYTSPDGSSSICGGTTGIGSGSAGNGDDYPFRAGAIDVPDPWNLLTRECVSFVAWRINQQMGWQEGQEYPFTMAKMGMAGRGNAVNWKNGLAAKGFITDKNPTPGSIAWWDANVNYGAVRTGSAGHVGIVLGVNPDGTVVIEQYNFEPYAYSVMTVRVDQVDGFIHVADIAAK